MLLRISFNGTGFSGLLKADLYSETRGIGPIQQQYPATSKKLFRITEELRWNQVFSGRYLPEPVYQGWRINALNLGTSTDNRCHE